VASTANRKLLGSVVAMAASFMASTAQAQSFECDYSRSCIHPSQVISPERALGIKRQAGGHALIVDVDTHSRASAAGGPSGIDVQVPFTGPMAEPRPDFAHKVDDELTLRRMRHYEPVILACGSRQCAVRAALRLQEHGYSNVYIVRYGNESLPVAHR